MAWERVFLGWDGPVLARAAAWLLARFGTGAELASVTVVTPGSRSGRRLMEHLARLGMGSGLTPPSVATVGVLADELDSEAPAAASEVAALWATVAALQEADPEVRAVLLREGEDDPTLAAWLAAAADLRDLRAELAGESLTIGDVAASPETWLSDEQAARWEHLASLDQRAGELLGELGLRDTHARRFAALAEQRCRATGPVVLVGMLDLGGLMRKMLHEVAREQPVIALIAAPGEEAEHFDAHGCAIPDHWRQRPIVVNDSVLRIAGTPEQQAAEVVLALERYSQVEPVSPRDVTVGSGDPALLPLLTRVLNQAGVPARTPALQRLADSPPATLLGAASLYLDQQRTDDLAALLRHGDFEPAVRRLLDGRCPLTLLDDHVTKRLARHIGLLPATTEPTSGINALRQAVTALLCGPDAVLMSERRPAHQWAQPIAEMLQRVYDQRDLERHDSDAAPLIAALSHVGAALAELHAGRRAGNLEPAITFPEALGVVTRLLPRQDIPDEGRHAAVEVLGWLELLHDEAPDLVLAGVNEGSLPAAMGADPLLPPTLRRKLGLMRDERRLARDAATLTTILHSRRRVTLIAGRRDSDGNPLTPSRLLLAEEPAVVAQRVLRFTADDGDDTPPLRLLPAGDRNRLHLPPPRAPATPLAALSVTAFRDYLHCPYRFYLKHVLKLRVSGDSAVEMNSADFGNCAHDVLAQFAASELADSGHAERIEAFFSATLDDVVRDRYGSEPHAAVVIQREQLRHRLAALAQWQAEQARAGWRLVAERAEAKLRTRITVDGAPFEVHGRIDRIDRHEELGWRILDYKTGDSGMGPEKTHCRMVDGQRQWLDLQLPLYRHLAAGVLSGANRAQVALGYVVLPKKVADTGAALAQWTGDDLREADEAAAAVIRGVRAGVFWPPGEPPTFDDGLARLCMDEALDRALLEQVTRGLLA